MPMKHADFFYSDMLPSSVTRVRRYHEQMSYAAVEIFAPNTEVPSRADVLTATVISVSAPTPLVVGRLRSRALKSILFGGS